MAKREFTKEEMKAEFARREEGYRIMERLRRKEIRETDTAQAFVILESSFLYALKNTAKRTSSGLDEWYRILSRSER